MDQTKRPINPTPSVHGFVAISTNTILEFNLRTPNLPNEGLADIRILRMCSKKKVSKAFVPVHQRHFWALLNYWNLNIFYCMNIQRYSCNLENLSHIAGDPDENFSAETRVDHRTLGAGTLFRQFQALLTRATTFRVTSFGGVRNVCLNKRNKLLHGMGCFKLFCKQTLCNFSFYNTPMTQTNCNEAIHHYL